LDSGICDQDASGADGGSSTWKIRTIKVAIRTCGSPALDQEIEKQWDGEDGWGEYAKGKIDDNDTPEANGEVGVDSPYQMIDAAGDMYPATSLDNWSAYSEDDEEDDDSL
jgi:hypothetical protein